MSIMNVVRSIAAQKRDAKLAEQQKHAELRERFNNAIADHHHGRKANERDIADYLDTVENPEAVFGDAVASYANQVRRAELRDRLDGLIAEKASLTAERNELSNQTRPQDVSCPQGGPLVREVVKLRSHIDTSVNQVTATDYAAWRSALRRVEDMRDRCQLIDQDLRLIGKESRALQAQLDSLPG